MEDFIYHTENMIQNIWDRLRGTPNIMQPKEETSTQKIGEIYTQHSIYLDSIHHTVYIVVMNI